MSIERTSINAIRMLGVDMVDHANSGHPGIVLGAAPMIYTLFTKHLAYNPQDPDWFNRDRFVLSAGHGSALLYSTLHLAQYDVPMEEIKSFRKWSSITPGHPEYGHTPGVEATTGPLGQGIAMAVGMAIGERYLSSLLNKNDMKLIDHYTYALCGDGDMQEGISQESFSLAGHLGLSKLIVLFDSNDVQLDGPVSLNNSENIKDKFEAMNWHCILVEDGEDIQGINEAITDAKKNNSKPTLIEIKTIIGHSSPHAGKSAAHGSPLGKENTIATRKQLGWEYEPFVIPEEVYEDFSKSNRVKGVEKYKKWNTLKSNYVSTYPNEGKWLEQLIKKGDLDIDFNNVFQSYPLKESIATRASSGDILNTLQKENPLLIGGSADLAASTKVKGINGDFTKENFMGRNINFGVREHAMAGIVNGMVLHGLKAFAGGFFIFSDYMKPAMRLSALMEIPSIYVFTHDSVAVGEDGPTHEPVEQLAGLRSMPNMDIIRPADTKEVIGAWKIALASKTTPTSILLTRQNVTVLENSSRDISKGAYIIGKEKDKIDALIIATGSEVALALKAQHHLLKEGIDIRVVSMPSFMRYNNQDQGYKDSIIPPKVKNRIAVEMGTSFGWYQYIGIKGKTLTIDKFGASAKGSTVIEQYGFNIENLVKLVKSFF